MYLRASLTCWGGSSIRISCSESRLLSFLFSIFCVLFWFNSWLGVYVHRTAVHNTLVDLARSLPLYLISPPFLYFGRLSHTCSRYLSYNGPLPGLPMITAQCTHGPSFSQNAAHLSVSSRLWSPLHLYTFHENNNSLHIYLVLKSLLFHASSPCWHTFFFPLSHVVGGQSVIACVHWPFLSHVADSPSIASTTVILSLPSSNIKHIVGLDLSLAHLPADVLSSLCTVLTFTSLLCIMVQVLTRTIQYSEWLSRGR